jgi:heme/copper-type cytochrome/quinol oxidase subunit 3
MSGDINSQAFWNEFMRRPDAKAAYQAERRLQDGIILMWAFLVNFVVFFAVFFGEHIVVLPCLA